MKVGIDGCDDPTAIEACVPENCVTKQRDEENRLNGVTSWNSEHVYEGNWIRNFLDGLQKKYFPDESGCSQIADLFSIGKDMGYTSQMLDCVGTSETYTNTMTLFPPRENGYKFRASFPFSTFPLLGQVCRVDEHGLTSIRPSLQISPPSTHASARVGIRCTTPSALSAFSLPRANTWNSTGLENAWRFPSR